ncbi:tetratricopeptide repeat protein 17-like [Oculina patagonica]
MYDFSLLLYFISLGILWSQPLCKGATHWIVTEDGRIQQQFDSVFNLKRPYDLVNFIRQQGAVDRLKILREEYLAEKRKVIEAREKERAEMQKSFYKVDPDCIDAGRHISEFELHLDMTLPFTKKGINIPDHLNLCHSLPSNVEPPICQADLPTVIYSYDHLEGVNHRHQLNATAEPALLTALSYFKTVEELGGQVSLALQKNTSSWVLLNLAAYYWRIKGNAPQAVECLRQALYFSPREHKDRALMSLAAVLHYANHTHDSVVLLHTALDMCEEYSVYHFLLGNIYASLKMYEMAELCYKFTIAVSPDTELLCERLKAVRCELKLKQLLKERQLVFDERMDSLKTPELDEPKESNSEGAERKHSLPLETYKRQLNRLYVLTEGVPKNPDFCKSRSVPVKQEVHLSSEHTGSAEKHESQSKKSKARKPTHSQQESHHITENASAGMPVKSQEKSKSVSEPIETSSVSKTKLEISETNDEENGKTILKEKSKTSETLEATNSQSDNSNVSVEEKTMHDLEDAARVALNRFKNVFKTVSRVSSASQTVDIAENKGIVNEGDKKTALNQPSTVDSQSTVHEKKSEAKKSEFRKVNAGRRGESGIKMSRLDAAASKEDAGRPVVVDDAKLAKQKGESISMSKNGPGSKFPSKNTREMPTAELLFENQQSKGSLPGGPKHTPPLKDKESLVQVRNCENRGRKKRKGEAFAVECFTEGPTSSNTEGDVAIKQSLTTTEFSKAATNEPSTTRSDFPPLDSDGEAVLMKQTSADEISATTSSDSTASERTSEAKVLEKSENKTAFTEDVVESKTSKSKGEDKASTNSNKNSKVKAGEDVPTKSKASEREIKNGKQYDQTTSENSEVKILETSEKKSSTVTDDAKSKTSDREIENGKDHSEASTNVITENPENSSDGRSSVVKPSSNVNEELPTADYKSGKALDAKKASQNIKDQVKNAEFLHSVGAGSSVFETSFMNVHTDGSLQDLSEDECRHIEGVQALVVRNKQFSAWLSLDTKNIDLRAHIDFLSDVDGFLKKPRCTAKMKSNLHTFSTLQGVVNAANLDQVAEVGLTQTLLTIGRTIQDSVDEMGTRIYNALKKNSSSWVLLNVASLYWRVQGDTVEAIKCLRQALYFSPSSARDIAHVGLASILLREGQLDDTAVVIKKALEISPSLALGHFILGNVFGAQNKIPEAIQHYLLALQLEPGFTPAVERLKIIQCVLWKQQKALEKEAADLKKLLTPN